jgi:hypothetical protein
MKQHGLHELMGSPPPPPPAPAPRTTTRAWIPPDRKNPRKKCPLCGHEHKVHRQHLTGVMVSALRTLHEAGGGPVRALDLPLSPSQYNNGQKLRYFGLMTYPARGGWQITDRGRLFLEGKMPAPGTVWTFDGHVIEQGLDSVLVQDVKLTHQEREGFRA